MTTINPKPWTQSWLLIHTYTNCPRILASCAHRRNWARIRLNFQPTVTFYSRNSKNEIPTTDANYKNTQLHTSNPSSCMKEAKGQLNRRSPQMQKQPWSKKNYISEIKLLVQCYILAKFQYLFASSVALEVGGERRACACEITNCARFDLLQQTPGDRSLHTLHARLPRSWWAECTLTNAKLSLQLHLLPILGCNRNFLSSQLFDSDLTIAQQMCNCFNVTASPQIEKRFLLDCELAWAQVIHRPQMQSFFRISDSDYQAAILH